MSTLLDPPTADTVSSSRRKLIVASLTLLALFSVPLFYLVRFAIQSPLYSHIVLIPLISLYLARQNRSRAPDLSSPNHPLAITFAAIGCIALAAWGFLKLSAVPLEPEDSLSLTTLSCLGFFAATCAFLLGRQTLRAQAFPLGFLVFMVPLPVFLISAIETLLQYGSAYVAEAFFSIAGTTVYVNGLIFQLSTIVLQIAPECSGIHSSLALFITSIVAGHLFLRSPTRRFTLALAVIPLALLRNGFRVFIIGELCVHIGPEMIDSYIHRHGGPIFFVLSLIPFSLLLIFLVRSERKPRPQS